MASKVEKAHAICIPFPAQGHVNPMLKLAKILHSKGFHITFVNNEYNQNRLLRALGASGLEGLPSFQFKAIPDGLPLTEGDTQQDVGPLLVSTERNALGPFKELIAKINEDKDVPRVSCIVADVCMFFTLDAAKEFGIPEVLLWTSSVCGLLGYTQYEKLVDMGIVPFKDANFQTNGDLDDIILNYVIRLTHQLKRASAIIFNSYESLEHDVLKSLKPNFPPTYALGPLQFILDPIEENKPETKCLTTNLWIDDPRCLDWLDSFEPDSVVYVNFGSVTVMTNDQLVEFAWGLANSNKPFLWITRPDIISGDSFVLPPEFLEVAEKRGLIVSWCNQEKVLAHPAVGGFLTHCGWNSTLESISNEVPMICWPFVRGSTN